MEPNPIGNLQKFYVTEHGKVFSMLPYAYHILLIDFSRLEVTRYLTERDARGMLRKSEYNLKLDRKNCSKKALVSAQGGGGG